MASLEELFPQYGVFNEHWLNHPAGLPVSQYTPGYNPNKGVASIPSNLLPVANGGTSTSTPTGTTTTPTTTGTTTGTTTTTPTTGNEWYNNGTTATNGFASRYTPAMMNQIYENPWAILPDVYNGISTSSPLYQSLRDMGADPLTLYNVMKGGTGLTTTGAPDFINWLAELFQDQGKVGGSTFDAKKLINTIFSQGQFGADSQTSLGQVLGAGDMSTQVRTLYNLLKDVSNVSLNPLAASAYQSALQQAGDQYQSEMLKTPAGSTADTGPVNPAAWIRQHYPELTLGLPAPVG